MSDDALIATELKAKPLFSSSKQPASPILVPLFTFFADQFGFDEIQSRLFLFFLFCIVANCVLIRIAWRHYGDWVKKLVNCTLIEDDDGRRVRLPSGLDSESSSHNEPDQDSTSKRFNY